MSTASTGASAPDRGRRPQIPLPAAIRRRRIYWPYATAIVGYHLLALLAFVPWFFSWTGVVLGLVGGYFIGLLGLNLSYHRLLAHRGLKCARWLEKVLAVLGVCCVQDTPARWVAIHRRHHQHADEQSDPHSPLAGFFWGHMGWLLIKNPEINRIGIFDRYAKDLLRDPFYRSFEKNYWYAKTIVLSWLVVFLAGFLPVLLTGGTAAEAGQFGASLLVWGVFLRTVLVWHQTWSVNSVAHLWGYRTYPTDEDSRNNPWVGVLSHGEGWHNNHHADPRSAKHGHGRWELDMTYQVIRLFARLGWVRDVSMPSAHLRNLRAPLTTRDGADIPAE